MLNGEKKAIVSFLFTTFTFIVEVITITGTPNMFMLFTVLKWLFKKVYYKNVIVFAPLFLKNQKKIPL